MRDAKIAFHPNVFLPITMKQNNRKKRENYALLATSVVGLRSWKRLELFGGSVETSFDWSPHVKTIGGEQDGNEQPVY